MTKQNKEENKYPYACQKCGVIMGDNATDFICKRCKEKVPGYYEGGMEPGGKVYDPTVIGEAE